MIDELGKYRLHRTLETGEAAEECLASFATAGGSVELCRLWLPDPYIVPAPEEVGERLAPLRRIVHPRLAKVLDLGAVEGRAFVAYEYTLGRSLAYLAQTHRARIGPLPTDLCVRLTLEVCEGLKHALSLGPSPVWWTHGDLRGHNVEVSRDGQVKVRGLGLARVCRLPESVGPLSPVEVMRRLSPAADARAAAALLNELIGQDAREIPAALNRVLSRALSSEKEERYPDVSELCDGLVAASEPGGEPWTSERIASLLEELFERELAQEHDERQRLLRSGGRRPGASARSGTRNKFTPISGRHRSIPSSGTFVGDRYKVIRELGQGGSGVVLEAEHLELGSRVAIKMLDQDVSRDPVQVERFRREARTASQIGHPNIVRVLDLGQTEDGRIYYVMELIRGENLNAILTIVGALDQERAVRIILQVCDALEAAHAHSIVHRDLKPENLMISHGPEARDMVRVVDFGLSVSLDPQEKRLTRSGLTVGTPYYMAPEQISGKTPDERTDVYSTGAILYEMLTGTTPFEADTVAEVLTAHLREEPIPPRRRAPQRDISPALEAVILQALEKKPDQRFQSMAEMGRAIRQAVSDSEPPADDEEPPAENERPDPTRGSARRLSLLLIAAVLLGVAGGMLGFWVIQRGYRDPSPHRESAALGSETGAAPDSKTDAAPGRDAGAAPGSKTDAAPGRDAGAAPGSKTDAAPGRDAGAAPGSKTNAAPGRDAGAAPQEPRPRSEPSEGASREAGPEPSDPPVSELAEEAESLLRSGQHAAAARLYRQVVQRAPGNARAWAGLGRAEFETGQHELAARHLDRAVRLRPNNVGYRLRLANSLLRAGQRDAALRHYREVLRQDPDNAVARRMVGRAGGSD